MGLTFATLDEEYLAVLTKWKTAGVLVESGCTDHIVKCLTLCQFNQWPEITKERLPEG